jgi:tRNA A-37 threonylcarbamoyl transferase component Bud32
MEIPVLEFTVADSDYYEPFVRAESQGRQLRPSTIPEGWTEVREEVWRQWLRSDLSIPEQGWKVHVSATLPRAQQVLDTVAEVCFAALVPFKHLATEIGFLYTHHKHGERSQAGKFCTVYPPDPEAAQRLMDELAGRLGDEPGPHILSDRPYRDSRTVHYRYGAFRTQVRRRPDGTAKQLVRDGAGQLVEDVRTFQFVLPDGVRDPFAGPGGLEPGPGPEPDGAVRIGDFRVLRALAQSNAGGAYRGTDRAGRPVFLKEARAHNGLDWDGSTAQERLRREHRVLGELHRLAPGLAPEPLAYFREWEHEFLVTELVPGQALFRFVARNNPYIQASRDSDVSAYFETCRRYLARLREALDRLHRVGYRFGDVNPRNMLVTDHGDLRLIDFESCGRLDEPPIRMGVPGFAPEREEDWEGVGADEYGLAAVALLMVLPVHQFAERNPAMLPHLSADAARQAQPVPADIWRLATRNYLRRRRAAPPGTPEIPTVAEVAAEPVAHLRWLRDGIARDLAAAVDPADRYRMYPTAPQGYATSTLCVAFGAAGVVHALHHAGLPVDERVVARLRRESLERRHELPPGLHFGTAGIGWVLAERGQLDEAVELVAAAGAHPTLVEPDTGGYGTGAWSGGTAGLGTAQLALHAYTGDPSHLDQAARLGDALCRAEDLTHLLGPRDAVGLLHGRAGIALFLHHLWRVTGEQRYLRRGTALLHAELDRAIEMRGGELGFADDSMSPRIMAYLEIGSAGVGHVLTRYLDAGSGDGRFADALPRVFGCADKLLTAEPGLYQGLAGLAFAHADHADLAGAGEPGVRERAVRLAAGLFKYATPASGGRVRIPGRAALRFSTELWSGSAGVLLALDRILNGRNGQFFTLENLLPARPGATPGAGLAAVAAGEGSADHRDRTRSRGGDSHDQRPRPAGVAG